MSSISGSGERILAILDLFREERPEWSPEEMMHTLGYSRPTLYRYLKTLKDAGYLVSLPGQGLTLGPRVTELDFLMQRSDPLIGVILSGMGEDGAAGIQAIKAVGGRTLAQDRSSSAVFGMPKRAIETGCVDDVLSIDELPQGIANTASAQVN